MKKRNIAIVMVMIMVMLLPMSAFGAAGDIGDNYNSQSTGAYDNILSPGNSTVGTATAGAMATRVQDPTIDRWTFEYYNPEDAVPTFNLMKYAASDNVAHWVPKANYARGKLARTVTSPFLTDATGRVFNVPASGMIKIEFFAKMQGSGANFDGMRVSMKNYRKVRMDSNVDTLYAAYETAVENDAALADRWAAMEAFYAAQNALYDEVEDLYVDVYGADSSTADFKTTDETKIGNGLIDATSRDFRVLYTTVEQGDKLRFMTARVGTARNDSRSSDCRYHITYVDPDTVPENANVYDNAATAVFKADGNPIEDSIPVAGVTLSVEMNATNFLGQSAAPVVVVLALYDDDDKLVKVGMNNEKVRASKNGNEYLDGLTTYDRSCKIGASVVIPSGVSVKKAKAFVVDSVNCLKPIGISIDFPGGFHGSEFLASSYGAKGDGVTDDSAAISAAVSDAIAKAPAILRLDADKTYLIGNITDRWPLVYL